jgi:hypothetical protein
MPIERNHQVANVDDGMSILLRGVYVRMLRMSCEAEVGERQFGHLALMGINDPERVAGVREAAARAGELFNERIGAGQPLIAWWYWFADAGLLPLPEPLGSVGQAGGVRRVQVSVDDRIREM